MYIEYPLHCFIEKMNNTEEDRFLWFIIKHHQCFCFFRPDFFAVSLPLVVRARSRAMFDRASPIHAPWA